MTDRELTARYKECRSNAFTAILCAQWHLTVAISGEPHMIQLHRIFLNRAVRHGIVFG